MNPLAGSSYNPMIMVFFFYGLSFFCMGLAIFLETGHASESDFARALPPLAGFGLVHGSHEWFEMFLLINPAWLADPDNDWITPFRLLMLAASFVMLVAFGVRLIAGQARRSLQTWILLGVIGVWLVGLIWVTWSLPVGTARSVAADVYTRYALAIPGAALAMWGLILQRRTFINMGLPAFGRDVAIAALAFGLYGAIGQLFATPSPVFPSTFLNTQAFMNWFGFPVQVFRAAMATIAAIAIVHSLRAFEVENRNRLQNLRNAQLHEQQRLEQLRAELLHRTVKAQESERQRIARELHDETGQTLTALGMGLRGLSRSIPVNPSKAVQQAGQLEKLAGKGIEELQRLVGGLHPPQIDDLGLPAALRWFAGEVRSRYGLPVQVNCQDSFSELSPELRIVLYRVAQEAITNTLRHTSASQASITLQNSPPEICLQVEDNGQGFDVDATLNQAGSRPCWGLIGMIERADLVGGECQITSQPGKGTIVMFCIPVKPEEPHA